MFPSGHSISESEFPGQAVPELEMLINNSINPGMSFCRHSAQEINRRLS